jgi:hypothetical protein
MKEAHKLGRILAIRAAINGKSTAYLDSKLNVKQSHNFTGDFIEKMVYSKETKKVTIYDKEGKEIREARAAKVKASPKRGNSTDAASSGDLENK